MGQFTGFTDLVAILAFLGPSTNNLKHLLKFFLCISKEEQLARFKQRLDDPARQWKISEADYQELAYWDDYMAAYEDALRKTSTEYAPWFVIPANHKWVSRAIVSGLVARAIRGLNLSYPEVTEEQRRQKAHDQGQQHDDPIQKGKFHG